MKQVNDYISSVLIVAGVVGLIMSYPPHNVVPIWVGAVATLSLIVGCMRLGHRPIDDLLK